jgi:poly(A) polymerase
LQPVGKIAYLPWASDKCLRKLMDTLAGGSYVARLVGGCVRDAILGVKTQDIDIAVSRTPKDVLNCLQQNGIHVKPVGLDHGTVLAVMDHRSFQITTLRTDIETYGRRAKVIHIDNWEEDGNRRDFTINALYADFDGTLYDPTGMGINDLRAGQVRFIGNPSIRIEEDSLRILRFFRFFAFYATSAADSVAIESCKASLSLLKHLSVERIAYEILRLLEAQDPVEAVGLAEQAGVLKALFPKINSWILGLGMLSSLIQFERANDVSPKSLRRLVALFAGDGV